MLLVVLHWISLAVFVWLLFRFVYVLWRLWRAERHGRLSRLDFFGHVTVQTIGLGCVLLLAYLAYWLVLILSKQMALHPTLVLLMAFILGFALASGLSWLYHKFADPWVRRYFALEFQGGEDQRW